VQKAQVVFDPTFASDKHQLLNDTVSPSQFFDLFLSYRSIFHDTCDILLRIKYNSHLLSFGAHQYTTPPSYVQPASVSFLLASKLIARSVFLAQAP